MNSTTSCDTLTYDPGYQSLNPPSEYDSAYAIRSRAKLFEPKLYVKNSWRYLKEYDAQTESMQKAKDYWLNYKCENPIMIVKRPYDVSNDSNFLRDAELIRRDIWKWHVKISSEEDLCGHYHKSASERSVEDKDPVYFFSSDPYFNRANKNIFHAVEIPETFTNLEAYKILEPFDLNYLIESLSYFPAISNEIVQAKRYWTLDITDQEAQQIKDKYPDEVEHFRELIWKRHLHIQGEKELDFKRGVMWTNEDRERRTKRLWEIMEVVSIVSLVAGSIFLCSNSVL